MNSSLLENPANYTEGMASQNITILLVGAVEDTSAGQKSVFNQFRWRTEHAENCGDALPLIGHDLHRVIVSEKDLSDGSWKDVLEAAAAREHPPLVIVTSRLADEYLWAEVLNLGGYDVLAKPFDQDEVRRTVTLAWQHWQNRHEMATIFLRRKEDGARERNRREN